MKENFCEEVEDQPDLYDATVMTPKEINPVLTSLRSDKYSYPASVFPQVGELLYSLVKCFHPKFVIETGTFLGYSAICIAQAMEDNKKGHLHSFDLFLPNEQYISPVTGMTAANMLETVRAHSEKANVSHRITFHKGDSSQQIGSVFEGREECVDLAFIDGDHTIQGCLKDWHAVDPLMNVGGIVILHDVVPQNCGWEGPRHLLDQIAKERADYYQAIELPTPDGYGVAVMQKIKGTKGVKKLKPTWRAVLADKKNRFVVKKHKIMRSLKGKKPLPSQ